MDAKLNLALEDTGFTCEVLRYNFSEEKGSDFPPQMGIEVVCVAGPQAGKRGWINYRLGSDKQIERCKKALAASGCEEFNLLNPSGIGRYRVFVPINEYNGKRYLSTMFRLKSNKPSGRTVKFIDNDLARKMHNAFCDTKVADENPDEIHF